MLARQCHDRFTILAAVSSHTPAQIIDAFMARASRVLNSELVDATAAQLEAGFSFDVRIIGQHAFEVSYQAQNEYYVKGLATDLRPFLPWVDDTVKLTRVMRAVLGALTDENYKRTLRWIKDEYTRTHGTEMFKTFWSVPAQNWQMSATDLELAKWVLNSQWFHEGMDPQIRNLLGSEHQQMGNFQAIWRLLNNTVLFVAVLKKFITEADDAGVLHPRTK